MALDFDGVDDVVDHGDIAAIDGTAALTVLLPVYVDALELTGGIITKDSGAEVTFGFCLGTNAANNNVLIYTAVSLGTRAQSTGGEVSTGAWNYWGFIYNGAGVANADRLKLYKDGVELALSFTGTIPATLNSTAATLKTGREVNVNANFFDCKIGTVKVWTAVLTLAELIQEAQTIRLHRTSGLVLWSPYDDGTSARDYSGNGNHGTVTGALQAAGPPVSYGGSP